MTYFGKLALTIQSWPSMSGAFATIAPTMQTSAVPERAQLTRILDQREQVWRQLIELGIDPAAASRRVGQMTDQQLSRVQEEIGQLPAGACAGTTNLPLIVITLILLP